MKSNIDQRLEGLIASHKHKSYNTDFFNSLGINSFYVGANVLRPEISYVSKYLTKWLWNNKPFYNNRNVLEIGCGSGIQSITICLNGAKRILSTDISEWAVQSTARNKKTFGINGNFVIRKGDLFKPLEKTEKFGFALFNHPFFDGKPNKLNSFESSLIDDRELAGLFLENVWDYMDPKGIALMPYSFICGDRNNPLKYAKALGLNVVIADQIEDEDGLHQIFLFSKNTLK